jgi:hypothetical protein
MMSLLNQILARAKIRKAGMSLTLIASLSALCAPIEVLGQQSNPCGNTEVPAGAKSLGYLRQVFCVTPTTSDISDGGGVKMMYTGTWYNDALAPLTFYSMSGAVLAVDIGGGVATETRKSLPGALPLLLGSAGFYVEIAERLSDNDMDHWPAFFLMPQEHNLRHQDRLSTDPVGYERWMELDVDEGGFNGGHHGAVINWSGLYPHYVNQNGSNDPPSTFGMDRTQVHVFGLSYDPSAKKVTWWVDGANVGSASTQQIPSVVNGYHYYLCIAAQNHRLKHPYKMYIQYFGAWSSAVAPNPPSGVQAEPVG